MLRKLRKRTRGQSTAEYAILIALVIAAMIAMQTYVKRGLQARTKDAIDYLAEQTGDLGNTVQFEPQYLSSSFQVTRNQDQNFIMTNKEIGGISTNAVTEIKRASGGYQIQTYTGAVTSP